tara:strand:+ start:2050 stop:3798 length:1749 start_codon:yes stop_codon:yes gene_type:complete
MKSIKVMKFYRLFYLLGTRRKKQIYFLIILLILNGIVEFLSISTITPFLSLIVSDKNVLDNDFISKYIPLNILNTKDIMLAIAVLFCIFILISTFLRIFNNWYIFKLTAKINIDLSNKIFKSNLYQNYSDYTKKSSSQIISLVEKVTACSSAFNSLFMILLGTIISLFIIISLFLFNWKIVLSSFLFLYIYYKIISSKVRKILLNNGKVLSLNDPIRTKLIQESFFGFRDILINNTEKVYVNLFNKYNSIIQLKRAYSQLYILIPKFLLEAITLLIIAILGYSLSNSDIQNSEFIPLIGAYVYALQRLLPLTQQTYAAWAAYKVKSASIDDVLQELESNINNQRLITKKGNQDFNSNLDFKSKIIFKNVFYSYDGKKKILDDICLEIKKGDHIGIFGETGSGKSTFLDIFMGLLSPEKGSIYLDKINIYQKNYQHFWTSKISHVPQSIFLKEGTIAENIAFGEEEDNFNFGLLKKAAHVAQLDNFIKQSPLGFQSIVGERGVMLSGGQRQRIAIARAIYKSRSILILDEATSALDENTEKRILESILRNYNGLTILMVTHRLNSLKNFNRVFKVVDGKILEQ